MKKSNYIALGAAGLAVISVFLPWVEASSSASIGDYSASYSFGGISGIAIGGGVWALLIALAGGFMEYKKVKWTFIAGVINFFIGVSYLFGWSSAGGFNTDVSYTSSFGGGSAQAGVEPQMGLYLFVLASLVFAITTYKNFKGEQGTEQVDQSQ